MNSARALLAQASQASPARYCPQELQLKSASAAVVETMRKQ
jgi:hypothetical protein